MVRSYILTEHERTILERYLNTNDKLNGFRVLIHFLKKGRPHLERDVALIDQVLTKFKIEKETKKLPARGKTLINH